MTPTPRATRLLTFLIALLLPAAALAANGRDLFAGYTWSDGGALGAGFFDPGVVQVNPADDDPPIGPINMGFPGGFPFYSQFPQDAWISDNGWITFTDPFSAPHPTPPSLIPDPAAPNMVIAPFWTDLIASNIATGQLIRYGRVNSVDAFRIQYSAVEIATNQRRILDVYLFGDGRIKLQYGLASVVGNAAIGIENGAGDDGIQIAAGGVLAPGVPSTLPQNYVIDILPPPVLVGQCPTLREITCGSFDDSLPGTIPQNITEYGCGTATNGAREQVYSFTLAEPSAVSISVTPISAQNLRLYLLNACDEGSCLRGPATSHSALLGAGRYLVVVDAGTLLDHGDFTLTLDCRALGTPIACGGTVAGDTTGGTTRFPSYACSGARNEAGPEATYTISLAAATNLRARLTGTTGDLFILRADPGAELTTADCVAWGDTAAVAWDAQPGEYLIVVDDAAGVSGPFTLEIECGIDMSCASLAGRIDMGTDRVQVLRGDTSTGTNAVELYRCDLTQVFDGPEIVYELVMPQAGQIAILQTDGAPGLSFLVLDSCNEGSCVGTTALGGGCGSPLSAGTHYLVVDGTSGAAGSFEANIVYEEIFNRWSVCQNPGGGITQATTRAAEWNFQDSWYCHTQSQSRNFPNGCSFAMYVTVRCGTSIHLPLYDVEGGHVRIFDLFKGAYVDLTALSTSGWRDDGDDIDWSGQDCDGNDPNWNNEVTDISFSRAEGLCGVFRLEFVQHSGNVWELFANCTGGQDPQFFIHDTLCGALADYQPLPNLSIVDAVATYNCPQITVDYTVINDGCGPAFDVPVTLFDGGLEVFVDTIPVVPEGATFTGRFTTTFSRPETVTVQLQVDAGNGIAECNETAGSACDVTAGAEVRILADCSTSCSTVARASIVPGIACEDAGVTINAATSTSANCPGGILEYQLSDASGVIVPWQTQDTFVDVFPTATGLLDVEVRCADLSVRDTCFSRTQVAVTIQHRPVFDPAQVVATDPCGTGIQISWGAATWRGASGDGYYNVYRSEVSCADARTTPGRRIVQGLSVLSHFDDTTTMGTTYYYVAEAEDGTGGSSCAPPGPVVGGATTRVDANRGTCVAIVDALTGGGTPPDQLARVETSLRLGGDSAGGPRRYGPSFVEMEWTTSTLLDTAAGHHFHVLRSDRPDTGWTRIDSEPPRLQVGDFTDSNASQPGNQTSVFYYLVFTSNECEVDNRDFDAYGPAPLP